MKNIPPVIPGRLSDDLYDAIIGARNMNPACYGWRNTEWVHLADAVSRGSVSPMDAWDAVHAGFVPENLKVRESMYSHLL